jgi:iron complex outermembrane recepter protein
MNATVLSRSLRRLFAGGAAASLALLALPAYAQADQAQNPAAPDAPALDSRAQNASPQNASAQDALAQNAPAQAAPAPEAVSPPVQRVEITGSSIKRLAAETALPVTTVKASDFIKQGLTTAQEVLNTIPMNQSSTVSASAVGAGTGGRATADLRGLGSDKTLVLLNGRRLANHPYFADTVDLNIIPVAALDRVEILRDGASAIYGTDAIGGVINFITKRSFQGLVMSAEDYEPIKSGGGAEQRVNVAGGYGDLNRDGWSSFGVIDWHQQTALKSTERKFSSTGVIPEHGLNNVSRTTFPANFFSDLGIAGNPGFATGCLPPSTRPATDAPVCEFDYTQFIDDIPKTTQFTFLGKANRKFGEQIGSLEYMHGRSTTISRVAPPPMTGLGIIMTADSPYYPGAGITPAVEDLTGEPLDISWRPLESGQRENFDSSSSDRLLASMEGTWHDWDYNTALSHSQGRARSVFQGGYLVDQRIVDGVGLGILNPFGTQSPAGKAYLDQSLLLGEYLHARINTTAFDGRASHDLMALPGGALAAALGFEARHDKATYTVNRPLASQASSSGFAEAQDQAGSRTIYAVFGEVNAPLIPDFELNVAARYDHYSDVGGSFNPKVSLRYQPTKQWLGRASFNKGFRAPTLFDLFGPQATTNTSDSYDDPRLCPGGVAVPGANPNVVCAQQQFIRQGGNPNLGPEHSRTWALGVVYEPTPAFTVSLDYWNIKLKDVIQPLPEQSIFGDFAKYQNLFVYDPTGTRLLYVIDTTSNLGEIRTNGLDVSMLYRVPKNPVGNFSVSMDGTYVHKYEFQNERGGPFFNNAGRYEQSAPIFRWRHNLLFTFGRGDWIVNLSNRYNSHYVDQNTAVDPEFANSVKHYSTWALSGTYTGNKQIELTVGVKNLLDADPPFTNQITNFQLGYDPRFTDPLGRTFYVRGVYHFF